MGLLLSVIVIYVGVIEFLAVYSHFCRSCELSTSSRDLSPLICRYEEGLYKERRRIINILERCKETQNISNENVGHKAVSESNVNFKYNVESNSSSCIPEEVTCKDISNNINRDNHTSLELDDSNRFDFTYNSPLNLSDRHVKFGESIEEDALGWSRTPSPIFKKLNRSAYFKSKSFDYITNNNYLTQNEALKHFHSIDEYSGLTPEEESWDVYKKTPSSDEDENRPFYELQFLHNLDGVKRKTWSNDSLVAANANAESSWDPNQVLISSDESSECKQTLSRTSKSRRFRKKKRCSGPLEVRHKKIDISTSSKCENDLVENVNENAIVEETLKEKNSAANAFWLIFSGEYTKAMNKDWHGQHFCCWQCDESLTGQRYVLRDEHPYCVACYESVFANSCEKCSRIIGIDSKDLSYKDKHWHEACFLCATCSDSLVDKQFGSKGERIYCGRCYDEQFASRCDGCGQIFRAGTKKMEYKTRQWHEKCFCCNVCKVPIGTQSFIPREQEIYCAKCYEEKYATRCIKCNKVITSGGVTYKNEPWHRECFTCTHCNTSLAGARFTSRDDKPYCAECFGELFAKRCTACNKPITGIGGTKFISFEDRHWHNDCFFCASCRTSLVGRGFITDADDIICPDCAKKNLM